MLISRRAFFRQPKKLLKTSVPSDMQQRAKGLVVFHVSKAYSPAGAYGNCCGIISKGVWSPSALTLQWFGGGGGKKMDVKTIQVSPLWGRGQPRGSCQRWRVNSIKYNFDVLVLYLSIFLFILLNTSFERQIMHFLLHSAHTTAVVTSS